MQTTIPATKAKNNFGKAYCRVYTTGDRVVVEKDGIPVVIIVPIYNSDWQKSLEGSGSHSLERAEKESTTCLLTKELATFILRCYLS